jgi:hypothetical protein
MTFFITIGAGAMNWLALCFRFLQFVSECAPTKILKLVALQLASLCFEAIPLDWQAKGSQEIPHKIAFCERRFQPLLSMVVRPRKKLRFRSWAAGIASHMDFWCCMAAAFWRGGSQDMQRHPQWGVPKHAFVPAFTGSTSDHLGYVTASAGLPAVLSEIAGGFVNMLAAARQERTDPPIDTSGPHGLSWHNYHNIKQGFADGLAASRPPSPFNDYGYGAQVQRAADQIGDGNGIAGWLSSLAGVDPQEPAQPAWPPLVDRPIRYLSSRTQ